MPVGPSVSEGVLVPADHPRPAVGWVRPPASEGLPSEPLPQGVGRTDPPVVPPPVVELPPVEGPAGPAQAARLPQERWGAQLLGAQSGRAELPCVAESDLVPREWRPGVGGLRASECRHSTCKWPVPAASPPGVAPTSMTAAYSCDGDV